MSDNKNNIIDNQEYISPQIINSVNSINQIKNDYSSNLTKTNNYDINNNHMYKNNNISIQTELSTMSYSSKENINEEEYLDKENNLNNPIIKEEQNSFIYSLLYGNNINDLYPKKIGNLYAYCYINNKPLIIIGSQSKNNIFIIYVIINTFI